MRFKDFIVYQRDHCQCGSASLTMICRLFGKNYPIEFIDSICETSRDGMSVRALRAGAKALGLDSRAGWVDIDNLRKIQLPVILLLNNMHYVVLYGIDKKGRFLIADPLRGKIKFTEKELFSYWINKDKNTGIAIIFKTTSEFGSMEKVCEKKDYHNTITKYFYPYRFHFLLFLIGIIIVGAIQLLFPFLTQIIVDVGIPQKRIGLIWLILAGELTIVIGKTMSDFLRRWLLVKIVNRASLGMNGDFIIKFLYLPMDYYEKKTVGDTMQRMNDFTRIQSFVSSRLLGSCYSFLLVIALMTVLLIYSVSVFLVMLACIMLFVFWTVIFLKRRKDMDYLFFRSNTKYQDIVMQLARSPQEIKIQGCHDYQINSWEQAQSELLDVQIENLKIIQKQDAGKVFIKETRNLIVNVIAASQVIGGGLTLGGMFAIMFIVGQLSDPIEQIISFIMDFQDFKISLERTHDIHKRESEGKTFGLQRIKDIEKKDIKLQNVSFHYIRESPCPTLDNVSLTIPAGKVTAIAGASGSGKTTLIKLLLGYYKCSSGEIYIGGTNLNDIDIQDWRSNFGVVLQNGQIFNDSIAKNITLCEDNSKIDHDRLKEAARIAEMIDFIDRKPSGFNTILGKDGEGLSQGQRQRILIARAVYRNPKVLILDEATNSLDSETEKSITENLNQFYAGRTVIIIAHRLSTIVAADNIIVLENGRIAEQGSHEELIILNNRYYRLIRNQLEFA